MKALLKFVMNLLEKLKVLKSTKPTSSSLELRYFKLTEFDSPD